MAQLVTEKKLKKLLRDNLPEVHWQAVETWRVNAGVPDLNGCYKGIEAWVELKIGLPVKPTPLQDAWLKERIKHGGRCFVMAWEKREKSPRLEAVNNLHLWDLRFTQCYLGSSAVYKQPFPWLTIRRKIFR